MCPVCIASAAAMAAGAGSTGGMLAICIAKLRKKFRKEFRKTFRKYFQRNDFGLFQKIKEKLAWQPGSKATLRTSKIISQ
jgi:hypothetical protein